ncbi:winged helix-turn-helix transcriptional regulator [Bacillus sp. AGMB 02131]|uniref:Winged helix-turn-helix transcriptional regulator n=1 Tax=Peribacillus faecalis TaxID=2772559 RepID=A0A927HBG4_9BACI|nr:carbohydrate kinase [Peribacillus faecalis]MBD3109715.1 winged helix-turn-helix transcriptional regulator [Peribacillus faecalis]
MNEKEALLIKYIKENPFISQNELAEKMKLSRSAVAGYISSLTKQGLLLGRAYVLPSKKDVLCVGGSNIDRKIQVIEPISFGTSNPASSSQSYGGVARNIAENLGKLGCEPSLLTVLGADKEGEGLMHHTMEFSDFSPSQVLPNEATGTYTAVLNTDGEMAIALADMSIYDKVTVDFIEKRWGYFSSSKVVMIDTNFPSDVLRYIIERCYKENITLCITPVSSPKIKKLPQRLDGVTWMIANRDEAQALANMKISNDEDFHAAAKSILNKGVENIIITRGSKGLLYMNVAGEAGTILPPEISVADVTGAGDSLVSGFIYAYLNGYSLEEACKIGISCSALTLQSDETVNPDLTETKLLEAYAKYFH